MPDTTDHHEQTTRLPRHVYRKQLKLKKRRQRRQQPYQAESTTDTQTSTEQDTLYLQQKAQWEAKEREYNLINEARKKVLETEKKARALAMEKWHASLRHLTIPTPSGYSQENTKDTLPSTIRKKFVPSERRPTYRDKFELAKKST